MTRAQITCVSAHSDQGLRWPLTIYVATVTTDCIKDYCPDIGEYYPELGYQRTRACLDIKKRELARVGYQRTRACEYRISKDTSVRVYDIKGNERASVF